MNANGNDHRESRRKFLTHGATVLAAGAALPALPALARSLRGEGATESVGAWPRQAATLERRNINGAYGSASVDELRDVVRAMVALPPEDPRNWYRQAMIHVLDCPHNNAWFLPWHRGYLYWFERIARKLTQNPSFALPYWDWTANPSMPEAFFKGDLLDTNARSFIHDFPTFDRTFRGPMEAFWRDLTPNQRFQLELRGFTNFEMFWAEIHRYFGAGTRRILNAGNRRPPNETLEAVSLPTLVNSLSTIVFQEFGGSLAAHHSAMGTPGMLEVQPHNLVHDAVGGYMGDFMSATDPVFWLHHGNVDRLWDIWRGLHKIAILPGGPWVTEPFLFFCDENGEKVNGVSGDYLRSNSLGYTFETSTLIPAAPSRPSNAAWQAKFPCQLQSTNLAINGSVTASTAPGQAACAAFQRNCQTAILIEMDRPENAAAWCFKVEIKIDGDTPTSFIHCGYAAFFGAMGGHGSGHMHHTGQLKIGIAEGMSKCLNGSSPGARKFTIVVRAQPAGNSLPTEILQVHRVELISL